MRREGEALSRTYIYDDRILAELARHGLVPLPETPPEQLRDAISDLYRFEIRKLRRALLDGHIPKRDYTTRVVQLRTRYMLLSLPLDAWATAAR